MSTSWLIRGEFMANCNCTVFCPCALSLGRHAPTEGYCQTWFGVRIDTGHWAEEKLDGLNVGMLVDIPHLMREGGWSLGLYIDERASDHAAGGIEAVFRGAAGGPPALIGLLTEHFLGTRRVPVSYAREGRTRRFSVANRIDATVRPIAGADAEADVVVTNTSYWVSPQIVVAEAVDARVRDWGRVWNLTGKSAEICAIDWQGP